MKDSLINLISPRKSKRDIRKEISASHTVLFRSGNELILLIQITTNFSGSVDWTGSPRALNREARSKSERVLNHRKSRLVDNDDADTLSDDVVINAEYHKFAKSSESLDSSGIG